MQMNQMRLVEKHSDCQCRLLRNIYSIIILCKEL